jgi:hypothetical protein
VAAPVSDTIIYADHNVQTIGCLPETSQMAISHAFSPELKSVRDEHASHSSREYRYRSILVSAMAYGLDIVTYLEKDLLSRVIEDMTSFLPENAERDAIMKHGIFGVQLLSNPEGAYFHLVDFSYFKGMTSGGDILDSSMSLVKQLAQNGIVALPGELIFLSKELLIIRISFALEIQVIVKGLLKLRQFLEGVLQENHTFVNEDRERECTTRRAKFLELVPSAEVATAPKQDDDQSL